MDIWRNEWQPSAAWDDATTDPGSDAEADEVVHVDLAPLRPGSGSYERTFPRLAASVASLATTVENTPNDDQPAFRASMINELFGPPDESADSGRVLATGTNVLRSIPVLPTYEELWSILLDDVPFPRDSVSNFAELVRAIDQSPYPHTQLLANDMRALCTELQERDPTIAIRIRNAVRRRRDQDAARVPRASTLAPTRPRYSFNPPGARTVIDRDDLSSEESENLHSRPNYEGRRLTVSDMIYRRPSTRTRRQMEQDDVEGDAGHAESEQPPAQRRRLSVDSTDASATRSTVDTPAQASLDTPASSTVPSPPAASATATSAADCPSPDLSGPTPPALLLTTAQRAEAAALARRRLAPLPPSTRGTASASTLNASAPPFQPQAHRTAELLDRTRAVLSGNSTGQAQSQAANQSQTGNATATSRRRDIATEAASLQERLAAAEQRVVEANERLADTEHRVMVSSQRLEEARARVARLQQ